MTDANAETRKTAPILFRTSPEDKEILQRLAQARDVTVSQVARDALREHVRKGTTAALASDRAADAAADRLETLVREQVGEVVDRLEDLLARISALEKGTS